MVLHVTARRRSCRRCRRRRHHRVGVPKATSLAGPAGIAHKASGVTKPTGRIGILHGRRVTKG